MSRVLTFKLRRCFCCTHRRSAEMRSLLVAYKLHTNGSPTSPWPPIEPWYLKSSLLLTKYFEIWSRWGFQVCTGKIIVHRSIHIIVGIEGLLPSHLPPQSVFFLCSAGHLRSFFFIYISASLRHCIFTHGHHALDTTLSSVPFMFFPLATIHFGNIPCSHSILITF